DFQPIIGHRFNFRATPIHGWNGVTDCEVLEIIPCRRLVYSWNASGDQAPGGLKTIVTWTGAGRASWEGSRKWPRDPDNIVDIFGKPLPPARVAPVCARGVTPQ